MFCAFSRAAYALTLWMVSRLISVGKVTGCMIRSSIYGRDKSFFHLLNLQTGRSVKLTTHLHLVPSLIVSGGKLHCFMASAVSTVRCGGVNISRVNRLVFVMETCCVFLEVRTEYLRITCRAILVFEVARCPLARCPLVVISTGTPRAHTDRHV